MQFFFFNDTATTEIYTLSLHDALPISAAPGLRRLAAEVSTGRWRPSHRHGDRKSTRLNSSHQIISYAVFCLKKKTFMNKSLGCAGVEPRLFPALPAVVIALPNACRSRL